jgi:calcineurin-like phosphoesterase
MSGSIDSVIGIKKEIAIHRFLTQVPRRLETAKENLHLQGVVIDIDNVTGKAKAIQRIDVKYDSKERTTGGI